MLVIFPVAKPTTEKDRSHKSVQNDQDSAVYADLLVAMLDDLAPNADGIVDPANADAAPIVSYTFGGN